jgi:hypothetical protein
MSDPKLILTVNGSYLQFQGGQPLMDNGLENAALLALFTSTGWCGNGMLKAPMGSDFEAACNQPLNRKALNDIRNAAERAIPGATVDVTNPNGNTLRVTVAVPYGRALTLTRESGNWIYQAADPAYLKVV